MDMASLRNFIVSKTILPMFQRSTTSAYDTNGMLDPLSVIVVLASNAFKQVGTKLSVMEGRVMLHDVSFFQGTMRTLYGDTKMNVKWLRYPILYACKSFLCAEDCTEGVVYLFHKAKRGLENLRHTYKEDLEIKACINTYVNIIQTCLDPQDESPDFVDKLIKLHLSEMAVESEEIISIKSHIFDELNKIWSHNKIELVIHLLREMDVATPGQLDHLFGAYELFLRCIHEKTRTVIDTLFTQK